MKFEDTWYYKLVESFPDFFVIPQFVRGINTDALVSPTRGDYLELYTPNIVILQIGIVDCAPRFLKRDSIFVRAINVFPKSLSSKIWILISKYGRRKAIHADVSPAKFEANLRNYFDRCATLKVGGVFVIKIAQPSQNMIIKNPRITEQVKIYNSVFERLKNEYEFISLIDPLQSGENNLFLKDGYHLNAEGNKNVFEYIYSNIVYISNV